LKSASKTTSSSGSLAVEPLIARVVQAESDARAAVEQCKEQGTKAVAAAQSTALQVADRTEQRITRLQQRMAAATKARLEAISAEQSALAADTAATAELLARIDAAVAAIAGELIDPVS